MASRRQGDTFCGITGVPSSSQALNKPCDVFINHRGPDVKLKLASAIYHRLHLSGVQAFLDKEELHVGDFFPKVIEDAMRSAVTHIAIFSEDYAASPWCLEELAFILETGVPVIPVFYNVKPADLRWDVSKGLYAEAFSKHKDRYDAEMLKKWTDALHKVSFYTGVIEFNGGGDLGLLLEDIVNRVQKEIKKKTVPLYVAEHPVGLEEAVQEFETARSDGGNRNVEIVGIVGMPGIGKTTLAMELYNRYYQAYDNCSFLFSVREKALPELQKQLLDELLHLSIAFNHENEGIPILAGRLRDRRVLVVLDDVNSLNQLNALLPEMGTIFGSGSLVIITTEDLNVCVNCSIHKMRCLNPCQAKDLFCWHAFRNSSPPEGLQCLVEKFIDACGLLPLSLKVIGGTLRGKPKEEWESLLEKIPRTLPKDMLAE